MTGGDEVFRPTKISNFEVAVIVHRFFGVNERFARQIYSESIL